MSDLEKVYSYAVNTLGSDVTLQLRWEGAGNCYHPADILSGLKYKTYGSSNTRIKYHATINLYEAEDSETFRYAKALLDRLLVWGATNNQTFELNGNVNVTRDSRSLDQNQAHIMFVRNIMPTGDNQESLTQGGELLQNIHINTVRNRANSISEGGNLKLGMSGAPGLIPASREQRDETPMKNLFVGGNKIVENAMASNIRPIFGGLAPGRSDQDAGRVMKNNGQSLGIKTTYYLTFVR